MTTACYLSLNKPHLTSDELDAELIKRFGAEHLEKTRTNLSEKAGAAALREDVAEDKAAHRNSGSSASGSS